MISTRIGHGGVASGRGISVLSTKTLHFAKDIYRHYRLRLYVRTRKRSIHGNIRNSQE
ncbi:uncharacterized protein PHALS_14476 [Plasmopara halstedii]|uniref:Uncharacterized protein n=1 Tax=Plasmopara halstedii TaxID=4781 RepID=A0A0P1A5N9_PLAHL|nr:uncharacterized protein PHALS_14476 [Plasmopara halstedii]CEG35682.1 hypothetical protein PHALS_14476 [Plasmopara halstedii]|eukprot:XP_024572051.1 hypothetical protein PHALS_14476 [Plasmopara halstedii]